MKRILALLCTFFVLTPMCLAEETKDYSYLDGMSLEDLMVLRTEVDSRLAQEGLYDSNAIPEGAYVVGTDIKAGTYIVKGLLIDDYDLIGCIYIHKSYDNAFVRDVEKIVQSELVHVGESYFIHLEEGQCLEIWGRGLYIFDATSEEAQKSWQP